MSRPQHNYPAVTVIRRALWLVAAFALGYAIFALSAWRPSELVAAAGVFVILIPVDMLLHREEAERRARARTPFGPLQKFGSRTYSSSAPYWTVDPGAPPVDTISAREPAVGYSVLEGGRPPDWRAELAAAPWWLRVTRRIAPPWWMSVLTIIMIIPAGLAAPDANAIAVRTNNEIIVSVGWDGAPCIELVEPDPDTDRATLTRTITCNPGHGVAIGYTAVPGQWVGVDPVEAPGVALACSVTANGNVILESSGYSAVNCLGTWTE